ncbi:MAG TPA: hypothetical protein VFS00_29950, partial [Polyangiaceae bacterium]|nr:hypothetical protein [Polyangiaceae bacterium]
WGANDSGQLGYGHTTAIGDDEAPGSAGPVVLGAKATQIAAGAFFTCALLEGGQVRCWGNNESGQLGLGSVDNLGDDEPVTDAEPLSFGRKTTQIAACGTSTCVRLEDASLRCWGSNDYGQLGYGHTDDVGNGGRPVDGGPPNVGGPVRTISLGEGHACALLESGAVRCWGYNLDGQLGLGTTASFGDNEPPNQAPPVQIF